MERNYFNTDWATFFKVMDYGSFEIREEALEKYSQRHGELSKKSMNKTITEEEKIEWDYVISQLDSPSISAAIDIRIIEIEQHFESADNKMEKINDGVDNLFLKIDTEQSVQKTVERLTKKYA